MKLDERNSSEMRKEYETDQGFDTSAAFNIVKLTDGL